jgi:O-antigen/teichoic acid export membrane protein
MISGFVVPKVILNYFGSDVNGLISSINQFLNYVQLLEGGLSGVIMAALYKPLCDRDGEKISGIIHATRSFFRKIGVIFVIYMVVVAVIYPLVFHTGFSYGYSFALVITLGMNLFVQYFFSLTYRVLLNADRKGYIVSLTQIIITAANMAAVIVCAKFFADILLIKLFSALIFIIQPVIYATYVNRRYALDKSVPSDHEALKQRWDGFGINLAYFVHTNTDVIILTIFTTLADVSVYAVYLMIVNAMKNLVVSVSQAIVPSFGKVLVSGDSRAANKAFDLYEFGMDFITVFVFTCGMVLITPFVKVYTMGITDADYLQRTFGIILVLAEAAYCFRDPYIAVSYSAGHFKQVTKYAIMEVILNLSLSIWLVSGMGITGVAVGTLVSMVYRMIAHILYLKNNILCRSPWLAAKKMLVYGVTMFIGFSVSTHLPHGETATYSGWVLFAVEVAGIVGVFVVLSSCLFYREEMMQLIGNRVRDSKFCRKAWLFLCRKK